MGQPSDVAANKPLVIANCDASMGMRDHIIPRRHLLVELVLAGIPVRRDVGVGCAKYYENTISGRNILPNRVLARNVTAQRALFPMRPGQFEWNMIGIQATRAVRDQDTKRVCLNQIEKSIGIGLIEMRRNVQVTFFLTSCTFGIRRCGTILR